MDSKLRKTKNYFLLLSFLALSCSKKTSSSSDTAVEPRDNPVVDTNSRYCRIPIRYSDEGAHISALEALVQATVSKKDRPTTMCIGAEASPLKGFNASIRVEYEDNYGLRWVTFHKDSLVYSNRANNALRLIYLDQYGYVEVNTTRNTGGNYVGQIRLANISNTYTYLDQIDEFLKLIEKTCSESPAKCLNPIFITDPVSYGAPTEAQILKQANDAFAGKNGADAYVLGTLDFSQDLIESAPF